MKHVEIMRPDPRLVSDDQIFEVTGRAGELFRLLVLSNGSPVTFDKISQLRDTDAGNARSKIRDLRKQLSNSPFPKFIENVRGTGYRAELDDWTVDADVFMKTVKKYAKSIDIEAPDHVEQEGAEELLVKLKEAKELWISNPAGNIPVELEFGPEFDALKETLDNQLILARLASKQAQELKVAIRHLENNCSSRHNADDPTWKLLFLAYHAIGNNHLFDDAWKTLLNEQKQRSNRLLDFIIEIKKPDFQNPFSIDNSTDERQDEVAEHQGSDDASSLLSLCSTLGISTASQMRLLDSRLTPKACVQTARKRLYFSGVLASKWVTEPAVRSEFEKMLNRFEQSNGHAKFMMINPKSAAFKRLYDLREGNISLESIDHIQKLNSEHSSLQVRVFDELPSFRIVVIDKDIVSFSPYRLASEAYLKTENGWKAPHVVLDPVAEYPLAETFELMFNETWRRSKPLEEIV